MPSLPVTHYFEWKLCSDATRQYIMHEFAAHGARHIALTDQWLREILHKTSAAKTLRRMADKAGLAFCDAHGLYGPGEDLITPEAAERPLMLSRHLASFHILEDFGISSCALHISADPDTFPGVTLDGLMDLAARGLETLLPAAEKAGVTLCLENGWDMNTTPERLIGLLERFRSPRLGVCYDSGHANIVSRGCGPAPRDACVLEKLLPHIVNCHLHDNDGEKDAHELPGAGVIDWPRVMEQLARAPRLAAIQDEVAPFTSAEARSNVPVAALCRTFDRLLAGLWD